MTFTQLHERLRLELLRRINRGTLSVSLLSRQTSLGQPHLSNFLRSKRQLSLDGLDRVLGAQHLAVGDLLPGNAQGSAREAFDQTGSVPVVSHAAAIFEPYIRAAAVSSMVYPPAGLLESLRSRASGARRSWQRFVAVRIETADALPMEPLLMPNSVALLDRHYNSLTPYRSERLNLYAIRHGAHLTVRYADFSAGRLVLRPHSLAFPVDLIEPDPGEAPNDLLAGRVVLILNEP